MARIFINFTNHPSSLWSEEQRKAALIQCDQIMDIPFPMVDPKLSSEEVKQMAENAAAKILEQSPQVVLCQGEFTLCFHVITLLKREGVCVVSACTQRIVEIEGDTKKSVFRFSQFRAY